MPVDYKLYLDELIRAKNLVRAVLDDLRTPLLEQGFQVPFFLLDQDRYPPQYACYASGKVFFERVFDESEKSLSLLDQLTGAIITSADINSQRVFDELSLRQRKLFEMMLAITMLSRPDIYIPIGPAGQAESRPGLYFLDYHISQEREYLQLRNKDLVRYFGGTCDITKGQEGQRQLVARQLRTIHLINGALCTWNRDTRGQFENVMPTATPLEKAALGFGYQQIFGAASSQIHLNMSVFYETRVKEREFLKRVDNLMLLVISNALRLVMIAETAHGVLAQNSQTLRNEFSGQFPDTYVEAALGVADQHDIVGVFEAPDFFLAEVMQKKGGGGSVTEGHAQNAIRTEREASEAATWASYTLAEATAAAQAEAARTADEANQANARSAIAAARVASLAAAAGNPQAETDILAAYAAEAATQATHAQAAMTNAAEYVSYTLQPINPVGRRGSFTDAETMVLVKVADIPVVLEEAREAGFITQENIDHGQVLALMRVIESDEARTRIIMPRSNATNMPDLYFVQRYRAAQLEANAG